MAAQTTPRSPARVVRQYALTSSFDQGSQAPANWRLLGSNDGGKNWATLDVQQEQIFSVSQRRLYAVSNSAPYNVYRLAIDRGSVGGQDWYNSVRFPIQLTALELMGEFVAGDDPAAVMHVVTASAPHPLQGPPENAFDGDPTSRWTDFGLMETGECWIQCRYAYEAEVAVTTVSQVQVLNRLAVGRDVLAGKGPGIISNLTASLCRPLRTVAAYALTSANDVPTRDPRNWRLLGSNDGGKSWKTLDTRSNEVFTARFQRRIFPVAEPVAWALYRLQIDAVGATNEIVQLAELEPLYDSLQTNEMFSIVVSAPMENPPREAAEMAFDGDAKTKWLSFTVVEPGQSNWIQWQYIPYDPDLPVINARHVDAVARRIQLTRLLNDVSTSAQPLQGYALTSADDATARDPRDWHLLGSSDQGRTWETLDARTNEVFSGRLQRRVFALNKPAAYPLYRLQIDAVAKPDLANSVQLAEVEPLLVNPEPSKKLSVVVSAQGEHDPYETADKLFDKNPATKWLDYAGQSESRASWIQWQYVAGEGPPVLSMNNLRGAQAAVFPPAILNLQGIVIACNTNFGTLGILDRSGIQFLRAAPALVATVQPGDRVQLSGRLKFGSGLPRVLNAGLIVQEKLAAVAEIRANEKWKYDGDFVAATVTGTIKSSSENRAFTTLRLELENGSGQVQVNILNSRRLAIAPAAKCQFRIEGIVEAILTENGAPVPGIVWVVNPNTISMIPPVASQWANWAEWSVPSLLGTNIPSGSPVRIRGTVVDHPSPDLVMIGDDTHRLGVRSSQGHDFPLGEAVEAIGFFARENERSFLNLASLRMACDFEDDAPTNRSSPLVVDQAVTRIAQIRELLQKFPDREFSLKVRGVITYIDMGLDTFYLQDGVDSLEVSGSMSAGLYPLTGYEENYVEFPVRLIKGAVIACGGSKFLGQSRMPEPMRHAWDQLMTGNDDAKWVEVEGIVTEVERQRLTLIVPGGQLVAWMNELPRGMQDRLMGAAVRLRGVCAPVDNTRGQKMGVRLLVPSSQYLDVMSAPPANPFDLLLSPIAAVMSKDDSHPEPGVRLVKIAGVVTYKEGRTLFVQENQNGLRVTTRQTPTVETGDRVEVVGLAGPDGFSPKLTQALVRKIGQEALPVATRLDLAQLESHNDQEQQQGKDATRTEIEAVFLARSFNGSVHVLELQHALTRKTFSAFLPASSAELEALPPGSVVRLHGVFKARTDMVPDVGQVISSFEIYLNSPTDIVVIQRPPWWTSRHLFWLLGGLGAVLVLALAWAASLRRQVRRRTRELEAEMVRREQMEHQVEKTHADLLIASRQAGMAEVATSVLHNVGNVLNSVNVSSNTIVDKIRNSRMPGLQKAVDLMQQQGDQLGAFFEGDGRGKKLLLYLAQLAQIAEQERNGLLEEVGSLGSNIEHIKEIVSMQQNYARVGGVSEILQLSDLIEGALRLNANAMARHEVEVTCELAELPPITVERHKVLQILVNLLSNAKQACEAARATGRRVIVRSLLTDRGDVRIEVIDNGTGIPPENLTRIFNQGFTTKKTGHGFGLHSSAVAAKQLHGTLTAHSEGLGRGATFVLELPGSLLRSAPNLDKRSHAADLASV